MFDIGWAELLLIAVVALLVLGPNEFPVVLRKLGRWAGMLRRQAAAWQAQLDAVTDEPPASKTPTTPPVDQPAEQPAAPPRKHNHHD